MKSSWEVIKDFEEWAENPLNESRENDHNNQLVESDSINEMIWWE